MNCLFKFKKNWLDLSLRKNNGEVCFLLITQRLTLRLSKMYYWSIVNIKILIKIVTMSLTVFSKYFLFANNLSAAVPKVTIVQQKLINTSLIYRYLLFFFITFNCYADNINVNLIPRKVYLGRLISIRTLFLKNSE